MVRPHKEWSIAKVAAQLAALVVLLAMVSPQSRDRVEAFGRIAVIFLAIVAAGLVCGLVVVATRKRGRRHHLGAPEVSLYLSVPPAPNSDPSDLRARIRALDWYQFERLVALTYQNQGFTVTRRGGAKADGGVDLILERDGQRTAVQCKHWRKWKVGVKTVREMLGSMTADKIDHGMLVTLRGDTEDAAHFAKDHAIQLVKEDDLISILECTGLASDQGFLRLLNDKRKFCPKCENEMLLRTSRKGSNAGLQFWGCSAFPKCRFTLRV